MAAANHHAHTAELDIEIKYRNSGQGFQLNCA